MILIPAIDLLEGHPVRLRQGVREHSTVFPADPADLLADFAAQGAKRVHIVDLDGAFAAGSNQHRLIAKLVEQAPLPIQVGGGIRTREDIDTLIEAGATAVVVGTLAVRQPEVVAEACRVYPEQIIVAVDARGGEVQIEGWTEDGGTTVEALASQASSWGAAAVLYTDVVRDGMHTGPNLERTRALAHADDIRCWVIASGGVGSLEDLRAVSTTGAHAVVVGRALYEGRFTVADAVSVLNPIR